MNKAMIISCALALTAAACSSSAPNESNDDLEMSMPSEQMDGSQPEETQESEETE